MTENEKEMMNSIFAKIAELDYIKPDEIPNIALYMDQVTTFMEDNLASTKRHDDDKILTKTMINNYAKNKLLPPVTDSCYYGIDTSERKELIAARCTENEICRYIGADSLHYISLWQYESSYLHI